MLGQRPHRFHRTRPPLRRHLRRRPPHRRLSQRPTRRPHRRQARRQLLSCSRSIVTRRTAAFALAMALVFASAIASASEVGSDGLPLNGMAPLYFTLPNGPYKQVSASLSLPEVPTNTHWYANWVMIVGQPAGAAHQAFVQIGLIRRPHQTRLLYLFCAWQAKQQPRIEFRQLRKVANAPHRFTIAEILDGFVLTADGREVMRFRMPKLAQSHTYVQIGPEVFAEGDALSGDVLYAAIGSYNHWKRVGQSGTCRYENHGVSLVRTGLVWTSAGRFDRKEPSRFMGDCKNF